jgi:cell wall-associated NlpC family hydrolase
MTLDPRLNACRPDLADARLKGTVEASGFADGIPHQIASPVITLHAAPAPDAQSTTQALLGETARVFDTVDGWSWLQLDHDGYVGYVEAGALSPRISETTHRVSVLSTFIYPSASIKSQPVTAIYLNSRLSVVGREGDFARLHDGGYVWHDHLVPDRQFEDDPASVAERFVHVPYLWGGITQVGLDCSGLVQQSHHACGRRCPRDSDMMEAGLGEHLLINDLSSLKRGDLVFWRGHVGMMLDSERLIHANGHHMRTVIEPLQQAVRRIADMFGEVTSWRRP